MHKLSLILVFVLILKTSYSFGKLYSDKDGKRIEFSSYLGEDLWGKKVKPITSHGILYLPKKALNNAPPNFIRHVYVNNQTASNGSLTESFIRSRASLSPSYFHNEIVTRYNMVSAVPKNITQLKKSFEKLA